MGFYGDLDDLPLQDILYVLSSRAKSGRLTLKTGEQEFNLFLDRGRVAAVSTSDDSLRIGRLLVDQGYVREDQMEQALALQEVSERPVRVGDVLVELGFVTRKEIGQAVAGQLEASLFRVLLNPSGTFAFSPEDAVKVDPLMDEISIEQMILNAVRRADEWIETHSADEMFALPAEPIEPELLDRLDELEKRVLLGVLNGAVTFKALAKSTGLPAPELRAVLLGLVDDGLLEYAEPDDQPANQRRAATAA